jgi:bla regulator protein BlaR1
MLCILYVTVVGALLGVVGVLIERMLPPSWPRRWVWLLIIPLSIVLPGYYRGHHAWSVTGALKQQPELLGLHGTSLALLDPAWWARTEACDPIINNIWLIASGVFLIWGLANAIRVSEIVRANEDQSASADGRTADGISFVVTDKVGPATVGLLRSRVLVPRWVLALPGVQRRYILRHEDEHRRSHDAHLLFFASLPILLMPWNLALWWQIRRLCLAVEMDCDNRVVRGLGDANAYGELLVKIAEVSNRGPRLQPAFLGGIGMLERRITALVAPTQLRRFQRFLVPAAALALLCVVLWMPHPIVGAGAHAHTSMATTTTPAR